MLSSPPSPPEAAGAHWCLLGMAGGHGGACLCWGAVSQSSEAMQTSYACLELWGIPAGGTPAEHLHGSVPIAVCCSRPPQLFWEQSSGGGLGEAKYYLRVEKQFPPRTYVGQPHHAWQGPSALHQGLLPHLAGLCWAFLPCPVPPHLGSGSDVTLLLVWRNSPSPVTSPTPLLLWGGLTATS